MSRRRPTKEQLALYCLLLGALSCSDSLPGSPPADEGSRVLSEEEVASTAAATQSDAGVDGSVVSNDAGTPEDPFEISTCAELQAIENDLGADYVLTQDIDCTGFDAGDGGGFRPIGDNPNPFTGTLDGTGHIVTGLLIVRPSDDWVGLLGVTQDALVTRIGLAGVLIEGRQRVGGLVGWQRGGVIEESFVTGTVAGEQYVGGIAGRAQDGSIANSYAQVSLSCTQWDSKANKTNADCGAISGGVVQAVTFNSYGAGPMAAQHGATGGGGPETLVASFFDCELTGGCGNTHPEGRPTAMLQDPSFYDVEGWDFETIWGFSTQTVYPCLQWQPTCSGGPGCGTDDPSCDGVDDDCDGAIDEDFPSAPTSCGVGACSATGVTSCDGGQVVDSCTPGTPASDDTTCDAIDDDCDEAADEDFVSNPTTCGLGACAGTGATSCVDGAVEDSCVAGNGAPDDPTCDGGDDDCDGAIDEDYASQSTTCGVGACVATGVTSCVSGAEEDSCMPGTPAGEDTTCDGIDDNCDGTADSDFIPSATTCGVGACAATGEATCVDGGLEDSCVAGTPAANDASCNAVDDDCDGATDEDFASQSTTCGVGACATTGATSCVAGAVEDSCVPGTGAPNDSICNGVDDDCDGTADEDFASQGTTCGVGACAAAGATSCISGVEADSCTPGAPGANDATCNGIDDDCDGAIDEDFAPQPTTCGVGACVATGATSCVNGAVVDTCAPGTPALDDSLCDIIDNDCDGTVDEDFVSMPTSCGIGLCAAVGVTSCVAGTVADLCTPGTPAPDDSVCDGLDNDCDGPADEDFVSTPTTCGVGECAATGTLDCVNGGVVNSCVAGTGAADDASCDGIDDDCDGLVDEDVVIDDANPCTADSCDLVTGVSHDPVPVGTSCDADGDACTGVDACDAAGICQPGQPVAVDDGNPCTVDTCDPVNGATHDPTPAGASCADWNPCNGDEVCDGAGVCLGGTPPASGPCLTDGPIAGFTTPDRFRLSDLRKGASIISDNQAGTPTSTSKGDIKWSGNGLPAEFIVDLREDLHAIEAVTFRSGPSIRFPRRVRLYVSDTGTDPADFRQILDAVVDIGTSNGLRTLATDEVATARYVKFEIVSTALGAQFVLDDFAIFGRTSQGGAVSRSEAGGVVVAATSDLAGAQRAISTFADARSSREWKAATSANESFTVDLIGNEPVVIDRVELINETIRDVEIWVSNTTANDAAFERVFVGVAPAYDSNSGDTKSWLFFAPTPARFVKLVALTSRSGVIRLRRLTVHARFHGDANTPFDDQSLPGTSDIKSWFWDFGDGTQSTDRNPVHTFPGSGEYEVSLTVFDENDFFNTFRATYTVFAGPLANFVWTPADPFQGTRAVVTDTSEPGDVPIVSIGFDGTLILANPGPGGSVTISQTNEAGPRPITLTVTDANGNTQTITRQVVFGNVPPDIQGAPSELTLYWGETWNLGFDWSTFDWGSDADRLICDWDFGDGETAQVGPGCDYYANDLASVAEEKPDLRVPYAYATPGEYDAVLTVSDPAMDPTSVTIPVTVTKRNTALVIEPLEGPVDGPTTVAAHLIDGSDGSTRVDGREVRFTLRGQDVSGVTDASGRIEVTLDLINGPNDIRAEFAGDPLYLPSEYEKTLPMEIKPAGPDTCGTDFLVKFNRNVSGGFGGGNDGRDNGGGYIFVGSRLDQVARVRSVGAGIDNLVRVGPGGLGEVLIPKEVRTGSPGVRDLNAFRVTAPNEVCVHAINFANFTTEAWLALPVDVLGTDYVVAADGGDPDIFNRTQFSVAAVEDNTQVTITAPLTVIAAGAGRPAGVPFTVTFDANESMLFEPSSGGGSFSGTVVTSNRPIAVFGGHRCAFVPSGQGACDHLVEQMPPTDTWGKHFLLAPFATRLSGYIARVFAAQDATDVLVDGVLVATLNRGEFHFVDVDDADPNLEYKEISTSKPAMVVQYAKGWSTDKDTPLNAADPFMLTVTPTSQFNASYTVRTIPNYDAPPTFFRPGGPKRFDSYLNLIVGIADVGGVRVDGAPVSTAFVPIGASDYAAAQVMVAEGEHRVSHVLSTTPIGVYVYGWEIAESYGYPGDLRLVPLANGCAPSSVVAGDGRDNECDGRVDEELANGIDDDGDGLTDEDLGFDEPAPVNVAPVAFALQASMLEDTTGVFLMNGFDGNSDPLGYTVLSQPAVGALTQAGQQVMYTPPAEFSGTVSFTFNVSDGTFTSAPATFEVVVRAVNDAPTIDSSAITAATEDTLYEYLVMASDIDDGDDVQFSLDDAPVGMTIDSTTGLIRWLPTNADAFVSNPVTVRVTDLAGAAASQSFGISVANVNDPPSITSLPSGIGFAGIGYEYQVVGQDPDQGDLLTYSLAQAPPSVSIDPSTGLLTWSPGGGETGRQQLVVTVTDAAGLAASQTFVVDVDADTTPPLAEIAADPPSIAPGETTTLEVIASDDTGISSIVLTIDGNPVALDGNNQATFTETVPGPHQAVATVTDGAGNVTLAKRNIGVFGGGDDGVPVVNIAEPTDDATLTYLHNVLGTVTDGNLLEYVVRLRRRDSGDVTVLARGYDPVAAGLLGTLDATLLQNGYYTLELRAEDTNGNVSITSLPVRIDGGAKLGVVQLGFVDANLNTLGVPVTIVRRYDSRDKRDGDFGFGWRLDVRAGSIRHNRPVGDGVAIYTSSLPFSLPCQEQFEQKSHFTEVRLTDREYYLFRPVFGEIQTVSGGCEATVSFEFVDGSGSTAELFSLDNNIVTATRVSPTSDQRLIPPSRLVDAFTQELYDPQHFAMTTRDGRKFVLSVDRGIEQIEDPNGNAVSFNANSFVHSDGSGLFIERDVRGRITRITDPVGEEVSYTYDAAGDLIIVVDQLQGTTQYLYEAPIPHHLTGIIDRQGNQVAAMQYTQEGRLRQLCDADGGCSSNAYDLQARDWTFFDATDRPIRRKYDDRGNVTEETDGLNHTTKFFYDNKDREIEIEDPMGASTTFAYDQRGNLIRRTEPVTPGRPVEEFRTTFAYDDGDRLIRETMPSGGAHVWTYDASGNQLTMEDADSNVLIGRTYGNRGEVLTETDRFGTVTFTYNATDQQPATMMDPDGVVTAFTYDGADRIATRTRNSVTTVHNYDGAGRPTFTSYGNGVTVTYDYGDENQWSAIEGPTFGRVERRMSAMGRLLGWTLPNGDAFERVYDPQGRVAIEIDELDNETRYRYDVAGRLESVEDVAPGNTTTFVRDAAGRSTRITDSIGGDRGTTYFPDGRIDTASQTVTTRYFRQSGPTPCDPNPTATRTTTFAYTPTTTTVTDPLTRPTVLQQNLYGLPSSTTFPGGSATSSEFDGQSVRDEAEFFPTKRRDELLRERDLTYGAMRSLDAATDLAGAGWNYTYEIVEGGEVVFDVFSGDVSLGLREGRGGLQQFRGASDDLQAQPNQENDGYQHRLKSVTSPEGQVTTWSFNAQGRVQSINYPFGQTESRTYDAAGHWDTVSRPDGVTLDYNFDITGRETSMTASDGTGRSFAYGAGDRVDTMTDATGTTTFQYDAAGRFSSTDHPNGSVAHARDALGRVTQQETNAPGLTQSFPTSYEYDEEGRLLWMQDRRGQRAEFRYDVAGRLVWRNMSGDSSCSGGSTGQTFGIISEWGYDDRDRIVSVIHGRTQPGAGGAVTDVLQSRTYERTLSGEPTKITREDGSYTEVDYDTALRVEAERHFDAAGTLLEAIGYTYDLDGNRASRTSNAGAEVYEYDTGSRLTRVTLNAVETQRFEYDQNGRVSRIVRDGKDQRLTWDALDRLVRIQDQNNLSDVTSFDYDGHGRRLVASRSLLGSAFNYVVGATGNQSLESPHLVADTVGNLRGELVYSGEHAVWRYNQPGPEQRFYLRDAMGTVISILDDGGNLIETFDYDAFGNIRTPGGAAPGIEADEALPAATFGGDSRFQGMWKDADTDLYYVRARYYDARTGRFLSRDPAEGQLETPESFQAYRFANNNPWLFRDPTGLADFDLRSLMTAVVIRFQTAATVVGSAALKFKQQLQDAVRFGSRQVGTAVGRVTELTQNLGLRAVQIRDILSRGPGPQSVSRALLRSPRSLQKFFSKHGADFGLTGNWNPSRAAEASRVIHRHVNSPAVRAIPGTYRGRPVIHHLDPTTGLNVIEDLSGNFVSGWRLGAEQLMGVLRIGRLF